MTIIIFFFPSDPISPVGTTSYIQPIIFHLYFTWRLHFVFHQQRDDVPKTFSPRQIQMFKTTNPALTRFLHCYGYKTALDAYGIQVI